MQYFAYFGITMLVLYCSQISQYILYLENTVHEIVPCKIWNPHITSTVLWNKNTETMKNDLYSQAALQSASVQWKCNEILQNT